jgi:hypothetical protein
MLTMMTSVLTRALLIIAERKALAYWKCFRNVVCATESAAFEKKSISKQATASDILTFNFCRFCRLHGWSWPDRKRQLSAPGIQLMLEPQKKPATMPVTRT